MADSDRTQRLLHLLERDDLDSPGGVALLRSVLTDVEGAYPAAGGANPLPVPAATLAGHAVNKGQLDLKQDITFDPTGGATGAQSVTVPEYVFGRVDSVSLTPSASRAAIFTARTGADVTTQLQAFVNYCKTNRRHGTIRAGYYTLSAPLKLSGAAFEGVHISGEGRGGENAVAGTGSNKPETLLDASALTTVPAIIVDLARGVTLSDLAILGPNLLPASIGEPTNTASDWLTNGVRDNRYSPQCAIAVDATTGNDPGSGNGYPDLTYAGLPGSGSAGCTFERLLLTGHNVGVMIAPNSVAVQGDCMTFRSLRLRNCHIGLANGQSQVNAPLVYDLDVNRVRRVLDTVTYGVQAGAPFDVHGGQVVFAYALFALADTIKAGTIQALYLESAKTLGMYGPGASVQKYPLTLIGIKLHTRDDWARCPHFLEANGPVLAIGCVLQDNNSGLYAVNVAGSGEVRFIGLSAKVADVNKLIVGASRDLAQPIAIEGSRFFDGSAAVNAGENVTRQLSLSGRINAITSSRRFRAGATDYVYTPGNSSTYTNSSGTTSSPVFDTTAKTVVVTQSNTSRVQVGDIIFWRMNAVAPSVNTQFAPALRVTSIVTNTSVTMAMLWDPALYDQTYAPTVLGIVAIEWAPGQALTGDTHTNTTLDNVSPTTILKNGDFVTGAGFASNTRVVSGQGTASYVLSVATTATATGVRLFYGRLTPPTLDTANAI